MNDLIDISNSICRYLVQGEICVLVSMLKNSGSSPRHQGAKMLIEPNGDITGTIGGGLLEAAVIKRGSTAISEKRSSVMDFSMENEDVNARGMICGGQVKLLIDYIAPSQENLEFFQNWSAAISGRKKFYLLNVVKGESDNDLNIEHALYSSDGSVTGNTCLTPKHFGYIKSDLHNVSGSAYMELDDVGILIEPTTRIKTLYCVGAGHVAKPTAKLAASVGFRVIVIDDRAEYSSAERFPDADEIRVIKNFERAFDPAEIDEDTFISIFTREHLYDRIVLEQALRTGASYIGLMASKKKRESIYAALKESGFNEDDFARVHSPIGLSIEAETPEELAVSIVGELIRERALLQ